ncbi:MAG: hypothetical protein KatS3mg110_0552 [Pirellulaceae bacterium]|nr:MAG: hypothetical protein KatS3mg110_0552 [Pirellulaceae bacterium]
MADPVGGDGSELSQAKWSRIERLVAEHHADVYGYLFRLSGSAADAEDLAQQTFLAAFENIGQLREPDKERAWLLSIARSRFLKWVRKRAPRVATDVELDVELLDDGVTDDAGIDGERLQQALNRLPPDWRLVLTMYYYEQATYREIAEQLGIPLGTVMSRLARAKRRLRELLLRQPVRPAQSSHGQP